MLLLGIIDEGVEKEKLRWPRTGLWETAMDWVEDKSDKEVINSEEDW